MAAALRPGGALAIIANHHISGGDDQFFIDAQVCYERWIPSTSPDFRLPTADAVLTVEDELDCAAQFEPAIVRRCEWEQSYSTSSYRELLLTYSEHQALAPPAQRGLLDCIASLIDSRYRGAIAKRYLTELRVSHLRDPS